MALNRQGRPSQKGGALDRTQFFRIFQVIATALGLSPEKRHPHVLKHSLATHLVAGNVNLALVKQSLGHRSKKFSDSSPRKPTTLFFGHLTPGGRAWAGHPFAAPAVVGAAGAKKKL